MILRSLKKLRITRPNIRRTKVPDGQAGRYWIFYLLLGGLLLSTVTDLQAGNSRRRVAPLERLKRKSATARWDELRQKWQFDQDGNRGAMPIDADVVDDDQWESQVDEGSAADAIDSRTTFDGSKALDGTKFAPVQAEDVLVGFDTPPRETPPIERKSFGEQQFEALPDLPGLPTPDGLSHQQLRVRRAEKRPFVAQNELREAQDLDVIDGVPGGPTATSRDILPKPITAILPYHDYSPGGEDPCEYLCPAPAGCPQGDESKPCPEIVRMPDVTADGRSFVDMHFLWEPSNLFHNPLYFEDHALERYGHTHHELLQPFVSVGKFGAQLIGLPYQMALHHPCERQYVLGWHRPGECVPYRYYFPPFNAKAAVVAGGVYTGLIFLIP